MSVRKRQARRTGVVLVGAGMRGVSLGQFLSMMPDVRIVGIADPIVERCQDVIKETKPYYHEEIEVKADFRDFLTRDDVDAVIASGAWNGHVPVCLAAMRAGKYAATEVAGANSVEDCWQLVRTSEETGMPCMMLENCCYSRREMMILNMVRKGLFGELVHAKCGYRHCLRGLLTRQNPHFRLDHNMHRNGDLYLTHGVGPVMQWLSINHGNRFLTIRSTASKSCSWEKYISEHDVPDKSLRGRRFAMGDVISSTLTCANGETVDLYHCISLPGPYSRFGRLDGTKGCYSEEKAGVWLEGISKEEKYDSLESMYPRYEHPLWRSYQRKKMDTEAFGHGGMDYLVLQAFIDAVKKRQRPPIDTYDTATLLALSVLSEESVSLGGQPVAVPDFTGGKWLESTLQ
ncbi:MAG: Gfo/Idh/MocA family oxidoreductase [Victivallales bacterium]|nr:Gfo/Idh/MocA family oxidoreductase [Victivallales bacterium]